MLVSVFPKHVQGLGWDPCKDRYRTEDPLLWLSHLWFSLSHPLSPKGSFPCFFCSEEHDYYLLHAISWGRKMHYKKEMGNHSFCKMYLQLLAHGTDLFLFTFGSSDGFLKNISSKYINCNQWRVPPWQKQNLCMSFNITIKNFHFISRICIFTFMRLLLRFYFYCRFIFAHVLSPF